MLADLGAARCWALDAARRRRWALVEEDGRDAGSSGWQVSRQRGALVAAGTGRLRQPWTGRWLEGLGSPGAAAGSRQARKQAGRQTKQAVCGWGRLGLVAWCG